MQHVILILKKTVTEEQTESERHGWFHSVIEKTTTEDTIRLHAVTIVPIQSRRNDLDDHRDDRQQETIDGTLIDWSCCSVGEEREMKKEETANRNLDTNTNINTITPTTTTTTDSSRSNISTDPSLSLLIKRSRVLTAVGGMVSSLLQFFVDSIQVVVLEKIIVWVSTYKNPPPPLPCLILALYFLFFFVFPDRISIRGVFVIYFVFAISVSIRLVFYFLCFAISQSHPHSYP